MPDLLIQAMSAKQSGDNNLAKQLLSQAIVQDPRNEAAWMLLSEVVDDIKLRRNCLERVLALNPENTAASAALAKLNTTPLAPPLRGERSKPQEPSNVEKTPPFTPPFTWDSQPEQYLALGDHTFPDISGEEPNPLPETPLTFDWANESEEPDKTIDKIFEAVSKPELASEPPPEEEPSWLDNLRPREDIVETPAMERKVEASKPEDPWLKELEDTDTSPTQIQRPLTRDDFSVSAEPELGLQAFTTDEVLPSSTAEADSLLWDNPQAKSDRLVILSYHSLTYANPSESDMPNILELFNQNRMVRDTLGEDAHMIKLESIEQVKANPKTSNLVIEYKPNGKILSHQLTFLNPQIRDEVLNSLKFRLGAGFKQSNQFFSLEDKILSPIVLVVLMAALAWVLVWGIPMFSTAQGLQGTPLQLFLFSIWELVAQIGPVYILLIAGIIIAACILWMVVNLRKPSNEVILKR